jgi:hypothetical protein
MNRRLWGSLSVVALCTSLNLPSTFAQDAHYWADQYGTRARLLAGAVIGSADDLAAVYYNPGALALVTTPQLLLSANVAQYTSYSVDVNGESTEIGASKIGSAPSLFAGEIKLGFLGKTRFAYSFLTRYSVDLRIAERSLISGADVGAFPELEGAGVNLRFESKLTETWVGFTLSSPLGRRWGLGISPYVTIRSQRVNQQTIVQVVDTAGIGGISLAATDVDFNNWRLLAKIGLSADYAPWRFGVTLTTPSLNIWGQGSSAVDNSLVGQGGTGDLFADLQEDVDVSYVSPASVGAGLAYTWREATTLHLSGEYFAAIDQNRALDIEPIVDPSAGDTLSTGLIQDTDEVLNFAVGLEHLFGDGLEAYAGFHSDFSARPQDQKTAFPVSRFNIWHLAGGASATLGRSQFTLGLVIAWGSAQGDGIPATGVPEIDDTLGLPAETKTHYFRLTGILGFTIAFE